jgi:formylglycine-generating enzyme required for sulfatase activity
MARGTLISVALLAACACSEAGEAELLSAPLVPPSAPPRGPPPTAPPSAPAAKPARLCPQGEVYVPPTGPAGFVMGRDYMTTRHDAREARHVFGRGHAPETDRPHRVVLTRPFCMDAHEVTVAAWDRCVREQGCNEPRRSRWTTWPDHPDQPVNAVDWKSARDYCRKQGKSLPTEAQWEWAATGGDGRTYPWGEEAPTCEHADFTAAVLPAPAADAGCRGGGPSPVGTHAKGVRRWPDGDIHDLGGNVWEWCLDNYLPYRGVGEIDPARLEHDELSHVVRGGGWNRSAHGLRAAFRAGARWNYWVPGVGLRCVRNDVLRASGEAKEGADGTPGEEAEAR